MSHGPLFTIAASAISTLSTPRSFFGALLEGIRESSSRISLASLYIGTGEPERALIRALRLQLQQQTKLHVSVQLDLQRALRQNNTNNTTTLSTNKEKVYASSAHHLLELFKPPSNDEIEQNENANIIQSPLKFEALQESLDSRVRIGLTLLPAQRSYLSSFIPPRFTETLGVFHAKAFVFDKHTIILSGANLSEDYFSNRQDRYVLIKCQKGDDACAGVEKLAEFLHSFVNDIALLPGGHVLRSNGNVITNSPRHKSTPPMKSTTLLSNSQVPVYSSIDIHPALHAAYKKELKRVLDDRSYKGPARLDKHPLLLGNKDICIVAPRMQLGHIGVCHDESATLELLRGLDDWSKESCHIATGYFNLTRKYSSSIVNENAKSNVAILVAAPKANGFFGARGISGAVPTAYSELARRFYERCVWANRIAHNQGEKESGVSLFEFERPGWTFHAKGLWLRSRSSLMSLVGSPNFGRRSTERDLEVQYSFATRNERLIQIFTREQETLWDNEHVAEVGRHVPSTNERTGNVWARPDRRIIGMTRTHGLWIHPFIAVFGGLF